MAPFAYDTPSAPLAGSIADIMLRSGDIRARLAQETARTNALTTAARMNMWGNIIGNVAQMPAQITQARAAEQTAQSNAAYRNLQMAQIGQQLQEHDRATKAEGLFNTSIRELYPQFQKTDPQTGETGVDYEGLSGALRERGVPDAVIEPWMTRSIQGAKARSDLVAQQIAQRKPVLEQFGMAILDAKTPETFAMNVRTAVQGGKIPPAQATSMLQMLNEQGDNFENFKRGVLQLAPAVEEHELARQKTVAEIAKLNAEAAKTPTPLPLEQQLLAAKATGDEPGYQRILSVITAEANAKRDPAMLANAAAMRDITRELAQAKLDKINEEKKPYDLAPDVKTTSTGKDYVDLSSFNVAERPKVRAAAHQLGANVVNKEEASALGELDNARFNQRKIINQISGLLPKDAVGRVLANPAKKLEEIFQTDDQIAAFKSWRTTAIQTLRAVAGSKGLRINEAEILLSAANDIPQITDTYGTAMQRYKNVLDQLQSVEDSILVHDRTSLNPQPETTGPPEPLKLNPYLAGVEGRK